MNTIEDRLKRIERKLDLLIREKRKEEKTEKWIPEKEAAAMMELSQQYFLTIRFKNRNGRHFMYELYSVESYMNQSIYT